MKSLPQHLWRRLFVAKSSLRVKLILCALGICWLAGCVSITPLNPETNSKSLEQPSSAPKEVQAANSNLNAKSYPEPTERDARKIHEDECIFFPLGSSTISIKEQHKVDLVAQKLLDDKNLVVTLIGHANDNGSSSFNLAVSDSRVFAVAEQLRKHGVQRSQIRKEALGSELTPRSCRSARVSPEITSG